MSIKKLVEHLNKMREREDIIVKRNSFDDWATIMNQLQKEELRLKTKLKKCKI